MTRTSRRILIAIVALVAVGGVVSYLAPWMPAPVQQIKKKFSRRGGATVTSDPVPVLAATARLADVPVYLDGVGTAKALNTVTVKPQVDGKLINISFTEGQDVTKGFILAKIDPITYQAQYDQAVAKKAQDEAQLANARIDLERYTRLSATNAINKQQLDTQRALVNQLEAQVNYDQAVIDNARAILSYTDIVAPIAGRTGIRLVDEGNIVRQSDANGIVVITQVKPISVFFNLPQQDLPELVRGMAEGALPVQALDSEGQATLDRGRVLVIDNQVDQTTGTVKLKAEFPNDRLLLWPGQFINVRLLINTLRQVVVVPTAAIQRGPNGIFVYVVREDDTVAVRPVTVSQQDDEQTVVASGVQGADRVVTTGFSRLADGSDVIVTSAEDAGQLPPPSAGTERSKRKGGRTKREGANQASGGTPSKTQ